MPSRTVKRYGWVPDLPDVRDHLFAAPLETLKNLPSKADLRDRCPPVYDQGELGSCTANAIGAAVQFGRKKQNLTPDFVPSRLFIYYNERVMENTVEVDSGAMIRDGMKSVAKEGVCKEDLWPYNINSFREKPSEECYAEALNYQVIRYSRLMPTLTQLKGCLASGYPFVFGFTVYDSFESAEVSRTGQVPMPASSTEKVVGGHAVLAVGYDEAHQRFLVRNSWGTDWGMKGYFTMPYPYLTDSNLSDDFWTIRFVEEPAIV